MNVFDENRPTQPLRVKDDISLMLLLSVLLRHRYAIVGWTVGTASLIIVIILLTFEPSFTSEASFISQGAPGNTSGGLLQVAGQLGISVGPEKGSESPQFYADLLRSRGLLRR